MATTIRVTESTRARAADLAAKANLSIGEVVDRALAAYTTAKFWEETRTALAAMPADPDDGLWERTSKDGLSG